MQLPILRGVFADLGPDFRTSLPRNMVPVPKSTGISEGYMRPGDGIVPFATGPDICRGSIVWQGVLVAAMGRRLVVVLQDGATKDFGELPGSGYVRFDYGFDRLAIAAGGKLFYFNGVDLKQVTDTDLGDVVDMLWTDGYFMTTDGQYLVVTDLSNPNNVNPLKYGSSEANPDPIVGLLRIRGEVYALNRYTIEVFANVGGTLFPFARIPGAQVTRGAIGTRAACVYMGSVAFLGGGVNEAPSVYLMAGQDARPIATREVDSIIRSYTEEQLKSVLIEVKADRAHQHLYVHLPLQTLVFDGAASEALGEPVWFELTSSGEGSGAYRCRHIVRAYDKWLCADPLAPKVGELVTDVSSHWGEEIGWRLDAGIVFNEGRDGVVHSLELTALTGRVPIDADPEVWTSYSQDGVTWSQERACPAGRQGQMAKRIAWRRCGRIGQWRVQRFRGTSEAHISIARLEADIEPIGSKGSGYGG